MTDDLMNDLIESENRRRCTLTRDAAQFHNRLRILMNIEEHELMEVGAGIDPGTHQIRNELIDQFMADPFRTFIRADDATAAAIWSIVEAREAKRAA